MAVRHASSRWLCLVPSAAPRPGGRDVRRDGEASKLARGTAGEKVMHFMPYLAVICIVGYVLGRFVKMALLALGLA